MCTGQKQLSISVNRTSKANKLLEWMQHANTTLLTKTERILLPTKHPKLAFLINSCVTFFKKIFFINDQ